jgi:hypothetical protein
MRTDSNISTTMATIAITFLVGGLAFSLSLAAPARAAADLHDFWDRNCGECHGHAGDFARRFLTVEDGRLQGRHHRDNLPVFLRNHYLPQDLVLPVHDMLLAQAGTEPRFRDTCGHCHDSAADLARDYLTVRDDILQSRETGRSVADFLPRHARLKLSPDDTAFFVDLLTRVEREVHSYR